MTRSHDNVPRWLDRLLVAGMVALLALCALAMYVVAASSPANAADLPPGWVEPPGQCVEVEPGVWYTAGDTPLPCGPTLLELATGTTLAPIDPETGCTPAVPSDGCQPPVPVVAQTQGCTGPSGYCTTEPPVTEPSTTTSVAPSTTSVPSSSTSTTTTVAPSTTTSTTSSTTAAPSTSTTSSVAVGPPPVPSTTVATGVTGELPVTGNTDAMWQLAAGACAAGLLLILVSAARRRS